MNLMNVTKLRARPLAGIGLVVSVALLGVALFFQYIEGLVPCPLCIFQRLAFIGLALLFFAALLHHPRRCGRMIYAGLTSIVGGLGIALAARHVYLQNLPAERVPECGPGLAYMLESFPFTKMLEVVLAGSGECAEIAWQLFGLSMPGWSLIWLVVLTLLAARMLACKD